MLGLIWSLTIIYEFGRTLGSGCIFFFHAVILPLTPDLLFYGLVIISPDHRIFRDRDFCTLRLSI